MQPIQPRMQVQFVPTDAERNEADAMALSRSGSPVVGKVVLTALLLLMAGALVLKVWSRGDAERPWILGLLAVAFVIAFIWIRRQNKRNAHQEIKLSVYDDRLEFAEERVLSNIQVPFAAATDLHESESLFLLRSRRQAVFVPRRVLSHEQAQVFRQLVLDGMNRRADEATPAPDTDVLVVEWSPRPRDGFVRIYCSRVTWLALPLGILAMVTFALFTYFTSDEESRKISPYSMALFGVGMGAAFWVALSLTFAISYWFYSPQLGQKLRLEFDKSGMKVLSHGVGAHMPWSEAPRMRHVPGGIRVGSWRDALLVPQRALGSGDWARLHQIVPRDKWSDA